MKKTLITLLALGGISSAATEPIWTSTETLSDYSISNLSSFSVAITLNLDTLKKESGSNFDGSAKIIDLAGTWTASQTEGNLDVNINGSSGNKTSTLYAGAQVGANYVNNYALEGTSGTSIFTATTDWTLLDAASLVFVKDGNGDKDILYTYFTLKSTDGSTTVYEGRSTEMVFTVDGKENKHLDVSTINFCNDFATSAQVYGSALSAAEAKAVGAALIPEPTTATLSLLALAGLAARRRRR